jgi:hypothetical protein
VDVQAEDVDEAMSVGDDLDRAAEVQGAVVWSPSGRCVSGVPLDDVLVQTLRVACAAADASTGGLAVVSPEWRVRTAMTLDEVAWEIETASYLAGVGPGPTSIRRREAVCVHDMSDVVDRYPVFARAALERAVFSSLSLPLVVRGATVGALTLYAESRNGFANAVTAAAAAEIASSVITWTGS